MKTRLYSTVLVGTATPTVKHFIGFPPEFTDGKDGRQLMDRARFVIIEAPTQNGAMLYRFNGQGKFVGDTWHMTIDDAQHQASYEYGADLEGWREIPEEIEEPVTFGLAQIKGGVN